MFAQRVFSTALLAVCVSIGCAAVAQAPVKYEPTLESLDSHPLPQWYAGAKLGIFIHWGLYSVPGWAPLSHPEHDFSSADYIKYNPYAEWYYNVMRIDGSPTQAYHREHYGADFNYYNFASTFNREIQKWNPEDSHCGPAQSRTPHCRPIASMPHATSSGN
jgi:alpha-L-fucosidase